MKAYKYRIYPNVEQKEFLAKTFGCVRKVYNLMLDERIKNYTKEKETGIKIKHPTPAKYKEFAEFTFLKEVDSLALCNAQINLQTAYANFYSRIKSNSGKLGFPKYKSRKNPVHSYTTNNQKKSIAIIENKYLKLPKFDSLVKIKLHREFIDKIKSVTISKTSSNKYYASILVNENKTKPIARYDFRDRFRYY